MAKLSAGLLVYRVKDKHIEVFLVHPGGPFWANKDENSWSIPKGEYTEEENPLEAAKREFKEETGFDPPAGEMMELKPIKQPSGKIVSVWTVEGDFDATKNGALNEHVEPLFHLGGTKFLYGKERIDVSEHGHGKTGGV